MRILIIWLSLSALLFSDRVKVDKVCEEIVESFLNAQVNKQIDGKLTYNDLMNLIDNPSDKLFAGYNKYCAGKDACGDFWQEKLLIHQLLLVMEIR